ncbi:hypothetical protein [Nonomuraea gerenzanensis]|uniref:hypothetical protein n=1 Tax=Nonomuraea gerenzanensis TaxID=93944 RepID=UPI001CD9C1A5|nr:hypothetical protein [Nonomuraea gerenzanensis]UBU12954.1 hypothetical protein LCN96_53385 [Nonomuraea gerenzanensis]
MRDYDPSQYWDDAVSAARIVANSYQRFETEDIAQAIMLDMCEQPQRYRSISGGLLYEAMKRAGYRHCQNEASRILHFYDEYVYSADEVKTLLSRYYDPGNWPNGWKQPEWDGQEDSLEAFGEELELWAAHTQIYADMFDVEAAVAKLRPSHLRVIEKKYRDREDLTSQEQKYISHALRLVTLYLNEGTRSTRAGTPWDYEGPGARKAMSNAQAQQHTSTNY